MQKVPQLANGRIRVDKGRGEEVGGIERERRRERERERKRQKDSVKDIPTSGKLT